MTTVLVVLVVLLVVGAALALRVRRSVDAPDAEPMVATPAEAEPATTRAERDAAELEAQTTGRFHRNGHGDLHASQEAERP